MDNLELALEMEIDSGVKEEEEVQGTLRELGSTWFLNQEAELGRTILVDAHNGLNKLICLAMLWTVHHCWLAGVRYAFNCYKHWEQLLLRKPWEPPVPPIIK